jgi:hypothetical protein
MADREKFSSPYFKTLSIENVYNRRIANLTDADCTEAVLESKDHLLTGRQVLCGIPFRLGSPGADCNNVLLLKEAPVTLHFSRPLHDRFLVFLHAADFKASERAADGIVPHFTGSPRLGELVAEYTLNYTDGTSALIPVKRRYNISEFRTDWGNESFECIPHAKPQSFRTNTDEYARGLPASRSWGRSLFRSDAGAAGLRMVHWIFAAENPYPEKKLTSITFCPRNGTVFVFGLTTSSLLTNPIRWEAAKNIRLRLPETMKLNQFGDFDDVDIDLGCIVAVFPLSEYNNAHWESGYGNDPPLPAVRSVMIEYSAHPQAVIYIGKDKPVRLALDTLGKQVIHESGFELAQAIRPSIPVAIRIVDRSSGQPVSAKLHIHSTEGQYLAPLNRHRFPNPYWFEDYSVDYTNYGHHAAYVDGETIVNLPAGEVFIEVTKGFEIKPVKSRYLIHEQTHEIIITLDHVLPWRKKGWVSADTHVHFLSPGSALLEGSGEGVNIVNLLASQWGELFTNMGDFDGTMTLGSREAGGSGEYLVRVGTENRQHVLGHISLLGYEGPMILPLTTGGTNESRLGDPVEVSLMDWARQTRQQKGLVILPHFPNPRAEGAAALVLELIDGVEMTSWGLIFGGISPYSLSDWYRYLNCGFMVPAVGGTDKMSASTPVGGVRTYTLIKDGDLSYEAWKTAVRSGLTFATYGPLLEFRVNGQDMGSTIKLHESGGTLDIDWQVSSVIIPVTKIELVVNGEVKEVKTCDPALQDHAGSWSFQVQESCWLALRIRGRHPDRDEVIAAHSSPIAVNVGNRPIFSKLDAMTILEQIEGATAYVKNLGSKAAEHQFKQLLSNLTAAHRRLHNRMHQNGLYHTHTAVDDHHHK